MNRTATDLLAPYEALNTCTVMDLRNKYDALMAWMRPLAGELAWMLVGGSRNEFPFESREDRGQAARFWRCAAELLNACEEYRMYGTGHVSAAADDFLAAAKSHAYWQYDSVAVQATSARILEAANGVLADTRDYYVYPHAAIAV